MAWLGKVPIPPNHPFAHSQVSFGMKRPGSSEGVAEKPKAESSDSQQPAEDSTPPAGSSQISQDSEGNSLFLGSPESHQRMVEHLRAEHQAKTSSSKPPAAEEPAAEDSIPLD